MPYQHELFAIHGHPHSGFAHNIYFFVNNNSRNIFRVTNLVRVLTIHVGCFSGWSTHSARPPMTRWHPRDLQSASCGIDPQNPLPKHVSFYSFFKCMKRRLETDRGCNEQITVGRNHFFPSSEITMEPCMTHAMLHISHPFTCYLLSLAKVNRCSLVRWWSKHVHHQHRTWDAKPGTISRAFLSTSNQASEQK